MSEQKGPLNAAHQGSQAARESNLGSNLDTGVDPADRGYSKDYWDLVFEQLGRRKLFKFALSVLALLYASAVFAPLLASDRPYVLHAVDYKEYKEALRRPRLAARSLEEQLNKISDSPTPEVERSLANEIQGADLSVATLLRYLAEPDRAPLQAYLDKLREVERHVAERDWANARLAAVAAQEMGTALSKSHVALPAVSAEGTVKVSSAPDAAPPAGVRLQPYKSYPLFKNLSGFDLCLMVWMALALAWPLWNPLVNRLLLRGQRERIRRARRYKFLLPLALGLAALVFWSQVVGGKRSINETAPYKSRLSSGEIVAQSSPLFPPISYGYAETHTEENFRPPTWTRASAKDLQGHYLHQSAPSNLPAGLVAPDLPVDVRYSEPERNAPTRHLCGVDELGRDFMTRMLWGGRISLSVGILSALLLTLIGVTIGSVAGYFGGKVDIAIMRCIEIIQSIPALFLILAAVAFTNPEKVEPVFLIVIVIAMVRWTGAARLVRGEFLKLRDQEFVVAARALGFSSARTIFRHVLPNAMGPVLVSAAFDVASGILTESAISFLGFGVQEPGASWGSLVNESRDPAHWWVQLFPGLLIFITVTCYNLVGDAVRDALDPKLKL